MWRSSAKKYRYSREWQPNTNELKRKQGRDSIQPLPMDIHLLSESLSKPVRQLPVGASHPKDLLSRYALPVRREIFASHRRNSSGLDVVLNSQYDRATEMVESGIAGAIGCQTLTQVLGFKA